MTSRQNQMIEPFEMAGGGPPLCRKQRDVLQDRDSPPVTSGVVSEAQSWTERRTR
jgi:hypothetical protein